MLNPIKLASKNFLSSLDTSCEEFLHILELAKNFKNKEKSLKKYDEYQNWKENTKALIPFVY